MLETHEAVDVVDRVACPHCRSTHGQQVAKQMEKNRALQLRNDELKRRALQLERELAHAHAVNHRMQSAGFYSWVHPQMKFFPPLWAVIYVMPVDGAPDWAAYTAPDGRAYYYNAKAGVWCLHGRSHVLAV